MTTNEARGLQLASVPGGPLLFACDSDFAIEPISEPQRWSCRWQRIGTAGRCLLWRFLASLYNVVRQVRPLIALGSPPYHERRSMSTGIRYERCRKQCRTPPISAAALDPLCVCTGTA